MAIQTIKIIAREEETKSFTTRITTRKGYSTIQQMGAFEIGCHVKEGATVDWTHYHTKDELQQVWTSLEAIKNFNRGDDSKLFLVLTQPNEKANVQIHLPSNVLKKYVDFADETHGFVSVFEVVKPEEVKN